MYVVQVNASSCLSNRIHSPVLTNFVANTEADQHKIDRYRNVQQCHCACSLEAV